MLANNSIKTIKRSAGIAMPIRRRHAKAIAPLKETNTSQHLNFSFEPFYRVILLYNEWEDDKPIAKKVHHSIPIITELDAMNSAKKARIEGRAIVVTVIKDDAEAYIQNLKNKGLEAVVDEA